MDDPLALGQRLVAIMETGARTATYKLATLTALIDHSLENLPDEPAAELTVPVTALAERVIELYWHQVRPFENRDLRQSTQPVARILRSVQELRDATGARDSGLSLGAAVLRDRNAFQRALDEVALVLVRQPLHRLQKLPGGPSRPFLFDDSWMNDAVSPRTLAQRGGAITLLPGVASALARLSGLLKPALEILWVDDVRRMNRWLDAEVPDVAGHLFGRDRISLTPVRKELRAAFGARCFYCDSTLPDGNPVDHVLPWSRVGIDGLANLVLACQRCNGDKSQTLPAPTLIDRAMERDRDILEGIAREIRWPTQYERVAAAARGIYRNEPAGSPTWTAYREFAGLDFVWDPRWLVEYELKPRVGDAKGRGW